ncbi:MFS transporter [Streptomyces sp. NPDC048489]|uniref:MFS transporter n=1 Tax=Streptomyces sp. NPDC048489 TaxID=3154504 RepID=UPI003427E275
MTTSDRVDVPPVAVPRPGRARWLSLLVVCLGVMMAFLDVTSTISALGAIQADLEISSSTLVWITSAYSLAVVSFVMSAGTLGDLVGRRRMFSLGATVFLAGSVLAIFASSAGLLIAAQAIAGLGGAAVLPTSLAIVSNTFSDPHERTAAIGIWAACSGIGLAVGPVLAGALLEHFSWHAVYLANIVIAAAALLLVPVFVTESKHPTRRLDVAGLTLGTVMTASATYAIIQGGATGYGQAQIILMYVVFAISFLAFVRVELRHPDPMLDLRLFKNASFSAVMGVATISVFGLVGVALLSVLYMQRVGQISPLGVGVRLLPLFLTFLVVTVISARVLVHKVGYTVLLTGGLVLMAAGSFALLGTDLSGGYGPVWPGLLVAGAGAGLLTAPSTAAAVNSVPPAQEGMAASAVNMARQLGTVLGPSVLGTLVTTRFPRNLRERLLDAGVPSGQSNKIVDGVSHGAGGAGAPAPLAEVITKAAHGGFTDAVHLGHVIGGVVLLVVAVPTALFVRHKANYESSAEV